MKSSKNHLLRKDALLSTIFTFIVAGIFYFIIINISFLDPFESAFKDFKFTDIYYSGRFKKNVNSTDIVLINLKHADRFNIAQAINKVNTAKPKVIGLDVVFKEKREIFTDSILKEALHNTTNLVTSFYRENDSLIKNDVFFESNHKSGAINLNLEDQNSVIRYFKGVNGKEFSFATQIAIQAGYISENYANDNLNENLPINYIGNKSSFLNFTIEEILEAKTLNSLKDKVVVFGYLGDNANTDFDIEDKHFTPLNPEWVGRSVPDTYGLTIHANILNMLIKKELIYKVPKFIIYILAFIITYITMFYGLKLYKKNEFIFDIIKAPFQLVISIVLLYLALLLLEYNIVVYIIPIIFFVILALGLKDYYVHLIVYLNKKTQWKSYLVH